MEIAVAKKIKEEVKIPVGNIELEGRLSIPEDAIGLVIFSHGSGSSRFSPRNNKVAEVLNKRHIGTLLFDLLTSKEDAIYMNRFDIDLLTKRLIATTNWVMKQPEMKDLPIGYFGASTGAASALNAAEKLGNSLSAVVSRGGRPDLSMPILDQVKAPVLLIVGSLDKQVIDLNQKAYDKLECKKELIFIPGATHLFEEPGKMEEVTKLSTRWFEKYFQK